MSVHTTSDDPTKYRDNEEVGIWKKKDPIELKRAISKIKKTSDALEGSIAGFGENIVVVTPSFAKVEKHIPKVKEEKKSSLEDF